MLSALPRTRTASLLALPAFECSAHNSPNIDTITLGDKRIGIRTSVLEEKATACNMLCCYADELKEGFYPWIDQVGPILVPLLKFYFHKEVRRAAVSAMPELLRSAKLAVEKGMAQGRDELYAKQLPDFIIPALVEALHKEPETEICASMLDSLNECIQSGYPFWEAFAFHLYFEELHSLKRLQVLNLTVESVTTLQKLARSPRLADSTNKLEIGICPGLTTLSTATLGSEYKSLQCLLIQQCIDLKELEIVGGNTLSNLTQLKLRYLSKAIITWKSGCLQNINRMTVGACEEIRQLIHCDDNSIVAEEEDESPMEMNVLPKLRELRLYNLPKLESLTCGRRPLAFPCLEVIEVKCCRKLKSFPVNEMKKLKRISGEKAWWVGLEWGAEGDNIRSKFDFMFT